MSPVRKPTNLAASVRARLSNLRRQRGDEFQLMLSDFAIERLLYRLGVSRHAENFVLKGATVFRLWSDVRHRATWDLDLHGSGSGEVDDVVAMVRELCSIPDEDGILFEDEPIKGKVIRAGNEFTGVRVELQARLTEARIPMQIDVGFGDPITPAPIWTAFPTILADHARPEILAYPRETVVAEKLDAMISLGVTNSRMKDFFDIQVLSSMFAFDGHTLAAAIRATFENRDAPVPDGVPLVLTPDFLGAPARQAQWRAFLRRGRLDGPPDVEKLAQDLKRFLDPILAAVAREGTFHASWSPGGPWLEEEN